MSVTLDRLWNTVRSMKDPVLKQDLVSLGTVQDLRFENGVATVRLAAPGDDKFQDEAMVNAIRREIGSHEGVNTVKVVREAEAVAEHTPMSVHLEVLNAETGAPQDEADEGQVDFSDWGPTDSPDGDFEIPQDRYEGKPPVFQWEIDPADPEIERGEAELVLDEWEYNIWWQTHPAELVYASIQALSEDAEDSGPGRQHPIGRNVAVNLVYDVRRSGVVAIYGTARDFRPFVEAFRLAYGIKDD